jgi:DNA recombination protein RmuC|tara:strand:+ start:360 stop:1553 length:1194 start_codon:yes stop_codon:yes gene_type:complete
MFDSSLNELEYILLCLGIILFIFLIKRKNIGQNFVQDELRLGRSESNENASKLREEIIKTIEEKSRSQQESINNLNSLIDKQLRLIQEGNEKKLEQMRQTVDEKLQSTLEKRLGESFKMVGEQLEAVQRGLGEMQSLATGVGDLKKVLTNVKARGTWGEYQLGNILEEILTPEQYEKNVKPKQGSEEIVEYAVRLPGHDKSSQVWLPIDSKFPQESYIRLKDASEKSDVDATEKASSELIRSIKKSAKDISDKYIDPPHTTDFAIMFLPTEGLYAEIVRQPGMLDDLQHQRIVVAGPTNLSAILNSLSMGFRTLAIENRSSEVRKILSAVKTEFNAFGDVLTKVKTQLDRASGTIDKAGIRTRAMQRKLKDIEELPANESTKVLGFDADQLIDEEKK